MDKKRFFTLTIITITVLAIAFFNSRLSPAQAQTSNPTYQLIITGLVQNPLSLTLNDIKDMPQATEYATLYCVDAATTPLQEGNWTGVELSYLLQQANVSSGAVKVAFFAPDGFTTDLTVQMATQDNSILIAYQLDNTALSGLQLVVPYNWGYKWISDLTQIKLVNYNFLGTEESAGYPDNATITNGAVAPEPNQPNFAYSSPNPATPTQNSTPTPTALPQSSMPTNSPKRSPAASNSEPQSTSALPLYIAAVSTIVVVSAVASAVTLIKRKKPKTLKQEEPHALLRPFND
jgi:hypothetical protein